ncbi:MAG: hypothetical protein JW699_00955 [Chitinispirillaceae bacterium]|nr:hypothetical protein [Chitinispirillaceae bacterium]
MGDINQTRRIFVAPSPAEARKKVLNFMAGSMVGFPRWYVGFASDPETALFLHHKVPKDELWIHKDAGSEEAARTIVKFFMDTYKTQGCADGGDGKARYIYAYTLPAETDGPR